jgi:hypothetical protein
MVDKDSGEQVRTWNYVEIEPATEEMKRLSRLRVEKDLNTAKEANATFNTKYHNRDEVLKLFEQIFRRAMADKKSPASVAALNAIHSRITKLSARDRRIICTTDIQISSDKDPNMHRMFKFREAMTMAMQEVLDDSCCMVQAVAENSNLSQREGYQFRTGKFAKQIGSPQAGHWTGAPQQGKAY